METPSPATLAVLQAAAMEMTADQLLDLRSEFVKAREHPATIQAIDRELKRRARESVRSV